MLNLKNMTFQKYFDLFGCYYTSEEKPIIDKLDVKTLEDLENLMSTNPKAVPKSLFYWLKCIKKEISKIEKNYTFEPDNSLFTDLSMIEPDDLTVTERNTLVQDLITGAIVSESWPVTFNAISKITIEDIRLFFQYKDKDKLLITDVRRMGNKAIQTLINSLHFYESQIIRQSKLEHEPSTDLFAMDRDKKRLIVEEEVLSYIDYIEQYASMCIWGKITDHQLELMHNAFEGGKVQDKKNKEKIITTFTNYLTLPELEDGVVKKQTLDRFFIR